MLLVRTFLSQAALILLVHMSSLQHATGQCFMDRHSTNWFDSWISCNEAPNPNPDYESGHWLLYDLHALHALQSSQLWNHNDPSTLDAGIKTMQLDISLDGSVWESIGEFSLAQAPGDPLYEGEVGPNFEDRNARYILLTVKETWGSDCAALSEWAIQAEALEVQSTSNDYVTLAEHPCLRIKLYPNPVVEVGQVILESSCTDPIFLQVHDVLGRPIYREQLDAKQHQIITWNTRTWVKGTYIATVVQNSLTSSISFIKS